MKTRPMMRGVALAAAFAALLGGGAALSQEADPLNIVDPSVGFSSVMRAHVSMNERYSRTGTERSPEEVRAIALGQSARELLRPLGQPAFAFADGSYEYHLSLPLTARDRLICQYRVFFDANGGVARAVWRRPQCADLVRGARG